MSLPSEDSLGPTLEGRKKIVFWLFAFFRPPSGDVSLGFGAPFWAPGGVFTARGLEKRKKPKNFESRAKSWRQKRPEVRAAAE